MLPALFEGRRDLALIPNFGAVFRHLWSLASQPRALELVGCLIYRSASMLDHALAANGGWRWNPDPAVVQSIEAMTPAVETDDGPIPTMAYLRLLELLALNEDVKYFTLRGQLSAVGRPNTFKTLAHVLAAASGRRHPADLMYAFMNGRGVAVLTPVEAIRVFPELAPIPSILSSEFDKLPD